MIGPRLPEKKSASSKASIIEVSFGEEVREAPSPTGHIQDARALRLGTEHVKHTQQGGPLAPIPSGRASNRRQS